jgi:hypothetical protein
MSYFKDRTLLLLIGIFSMIVMIALGFHVSSNNSNTNLQKNFPYSNLNLSEGQKKVLDIALNDKNVKNDMNGRKYIITQVVENNFNMSNMGSFVQIDFLNNDGTLDHHLLVIVDVQNNNVTWAIPEKPVPIR